MRQIILIIATLFFLNLAYGQEKTIDNDHHPFMNGVYLSDLKLTIPWVVNRSTIEALGEPEIIRSPYRKSMKMIRWNSVHILDSFKVDVTFTLPKGRFKSGKNYHNYEFLIFLDSATSSHLIHYFNTNYRTGNVVTKYPFYQPRHCGYLIAW